MTTPLRLLLLPVLVVVAACGGELAEDPSTNPASKPEEPVVIHVPTDPSDPDFLPAGMYALSMSDASCNVNDYFQTNAETFLVRHGTRVNMPLPSRAVPPDAVMSGAPRQDWDLERKVLKFDTKWEWLCPDSPITITLTMTSLTATRVEFEYREEPRECVHPSCSMKFAFELARAACLPSTHPECVPGRTRFEVAKNVFQEADCECAK